MFWTKQVRIGLSVCLLGLGLLLGGCGNKQTVIKHEPADQETQVKLEKLNATADQMYKLLTEGQVVEARDKLLDIGKQVTSIRFDGMVSIEGVTALNETILSAQKVFNAVKFSTQDGQLAAAKVRLVTDALTHANRPMWLQYEKVLMDDNAALLKALEGTNKAEALKQLEKLEAHYLVIRPSALISREPYRIEKVDSLFVFLKTQLQLKSVQFPQTADGAKQMQEAFDELFHNQDSAAFVPIIDNERPIVWSLGILSVIVAVLAFAAWRMFEVERNIVPVRKRPDE
ncbi:sporulation protein YpjB [Paenibacillus sp. y28]|uniref:sporulation protein YpjB n=1 Tax=Paenibacillus sp. y28 TaxID=3129110 RepID=UPI0030175C17